MMESRHWRANRGSARSALGSSGRGGHLGIFMETRTVKGSHVLQVKQWIDERVGIGTFSELTKHAPENWSIILPMTWYEVDILHNALAEACKKTRVSMEEAATQIARRNAAADLTSLYRFFMRVAQPQRLLTHTPRLWRTYVNFADASAVKNEDGHYVGQGDGLDEELVAWACGCWAGFIPLAVELAGGKDVRSRIIKRWRNGNGKYSLQLEVFYDFTAGRWLR